MMEFSLRVDCIYLFLFSSTFYHQSISTIMMSQSIYDPKGENKFNNQLGYPNRGFLSSSKKTSTNRELWIKRLPDLNKRFLEMKGFSSERK